MAKAIKSLLILLSFLISAPAFADDSAPVTVWDLNGDLSTSIGTASALGAVGGWAPTYENFDGSAGNEVMRFSAFESNQWLFADTADMSANGGGAFVNNYTIVMDVKFDDADKWISLYQTNDVNSNDGDLFIESDGTGIGISGDYGDAPQFDFIDDTWYRIGIVNDVSSGDISIYVDGNLVNTVNVLSVDGRWSLYPDTDPSGVLMLADNSGPSETGSGALGSLAFWDSALEASDLAQLGGASAQGIYSIPEPTSLTLIASLLGFAAIRRRRK